MTTVILGTADVGAKITQDELEKALDFCAGKYYTLQIQILSNSYKQVFFSQTTRN